MNATTETIELYQQWENRIVLGTRNAGKQREFDRLMRPLDISVVALSDFSNAMEIVEDGSTFAENACKKATQQAAHLQQWVLGEDSGLCVQALKGAPGIYSARYAGEDADDAANNAKLLKALQGMGREKRNAYYVCHIALSAPDGRVVIQSEARCYGRIRTEAAGEHGFGYDPLFEVAEYHQTFGQLGPAAKSVLSHRARAMRRFLPQFTQLVAESARG